MNPFADQEHGFWDQERPAPTSVLVGGVELAAGSRVLLRPRRRGDIMDMILAGKVARVEAIEQDLENTIHVAVTIEDDPGRDLGLARQPGHRFFFALDEVEPLDETDQLDEARGHEAGHRQADAPNGAGDGDVDAPRESRAGRTWGDAYPGQPEGAV